MKIDLIAMDYPRLPQKRNSNTSHVILHRPGENPRIIMNNVRLRNISHHIVDTTTAIYGDFVGSFTFKDLQDNDVIFYPSDNVGYSPRILPLTMEMYALGEIVAPFNVEPTVLGLASGFETQHDIVLCTNTAEPLVEKAVEIWQQAVALYNDYPAFGHIMMKKDGATVPCSLVGLAATQDSIVQENIASLFLTVKRHSISGSTVSVSVANRILDHIKFDEHFQLLTQEEQVAHFIEFSKMSSGTKHEYVPDSLIDAIKESAEYEHVKELFAKQGLGCSKTQQFNVLQQTGYLSNRPAGNIMYNLSDMGAGKTLMTVESILLMDLRAIAKWCEIKDYGENDLTIQNVRLPDKHIIAPTLSIKSSWVDTFKDFYNVEKINDTIYTMTLEYMGITAICSLHIAPFTVKSGLLFVKDKLPTPRTNDYLIIDEIHQIVVRNVATSKFFPSGTNPSQTYRTFVLSGTMSNLKTSQWYNYLRFMGIPVTDHSPHEAKQNVVKLKRDEKRALADATLSVRSAQRRQFDCDPFTAENTHFVKGKEKITSIEEEFFVKYGTQIVSMPSMSNDTSVALDSLLADDNAPYELCIDSTEADTTNFQLFYHLIGSKAVTAQSTQIAEELFGEQKQQHVSDIIKTVSPLSDEDIALLKVLHRIAEDHSQYKSISIAKAINTAILNLNDGLQTKNIYDVISRYADKNLRFFEYLTTLDLNILEKLPESGLITMPNLEDTDKFKILQDILAREKDETHLIVVNDFHALRSLSTALGIEHITKQELSDEMSYQDTLDGLFEKQSIVVVTQDMIKSSLDLVQANRLIQYQLNTEISDIIQTQNRINRIGQTRETRGYYIASDALQENLIELFLASYRNIRVAHKGIVELFVDITSQINIVNNYLEKALRALEGDSDEIDEVITPDIMNITIPEDESIRADEGIVEAILYPQDGSVWVMVPLESGSAHPLGSLSDEKASELDITAPQAIMVNIETYTLCEHA